MMSIQTALKNNKLMAADKFFAVGVRPLHMKLLLSSTALLLTLSNPSFASDLELKPVSDLSASYKLAKVCFLPDCGEDFGINIDIPIESKWCEKKGYTYYATGACPQYQKETDTCKKDNHYLKCSAEAWCKDNGYNTSTCSLPKFLDTQCPNGEGLYKECKEDTARACKQVGYTNVCSGSQKLHASNGRCSWNNSYGTCCSPSGCPSHTGLSGAYGDSGSQDGCGYKCYYTCDMNCPSSYPYSSDPTGCSYRTTNGCGNKNCYQYKSCCTAYSSETGCSCGTTSCSDGCGGTRSCCKSCPPPPSCSCSGPANGLTIYSCQNTSGGRWKYDGQYWTSCSGCDTSFQARFQYPGYYSSLSECMSARGYSHNDYVYENI